MCETVLCEMYRSQDADSEDITLLTDIAVVGKNVCRFWLLLKTRFADSAAPRVVGEMLMLMLRLDYPT